jgi:hypothetical protein
MNPGTYKLDFCITMVILYVRGERQKGKKKKAPEALGEAANSISAEGSPS